MIPLIERYIQAHNPCALFFADRVQPFGYAIQGTEKPYGTWQIVGGAPMNSLSCAYTMAEVVVQFDVWARNVRELQEGASLLIEALEPHACITSFNMSGFDIEAKLYRYSFDVEFKLERV